jgi:hypothetical protein
MEGFRLEVMVVEVTDFVVASTTCRSTDEVLGAKFASPAKLAVIFEIPTSKEEVVKEATAPVKAAVPRIMDPFLNVTRSPFGGNPVVANTVAVNVTACPLKDRMADEVTIVVVEAMIRWLRREDTLPVLFASPAYRAEIGLVPGFANDVVRVAWFRLTIAVPSIFDPDENTTAPEARPPYWLFTVAV